MADMFPPAIASLIGSKTVYTSVTVDAIVTGANTRSSMLPADTKTGNAFITIPAGGLPIGAHLLLFGGGTIGARLTTPPGFNFIPWVTPSGGSKTDLTGFSAAPLLGTDGLCRIPWMKFTQTSAGIRTAGYIDYGTVGGQWYTFGVNTGATGVSGALPVVTASDPNVARDFGVDGYWGTGADTREYVKCRSVTVMLVPPA